MTLGRSRIRELQFWLTWCMEDKNFRNSQISLSSGLSFVISNGSASCWWCSFAPLLREQHESIWVQANRQHSSNVSRQKQQVLLVPAQGLALCCWFQPLAVLKTRQTLSMGAGHAADVQKLPKYWLPSKICHHQKHPVWLPIERLQVKEWTALSCDLAFAMWSNFLVSCSFISNCSGIKSGVFF